MFLGYGRGMMRRFTPGRGFGWGRGRGFGFGLAKGFGRRPFYGRGRGRFPGYGMGIPYRIPRRYAWFY
jgi:hypothetical protein